MRSPRPLPPHLLRHVVAAAALLGQVVAAVGAPVPSRALANKSASVPFPCLGHPCGCSTSEQGWAGDCCCFTLEEKLAWADAGEPSVPSDRAGILVRDTRDCLVEGNRLRDVTFGIYLRRSTGCVVRRNDVVAHVTLQSGGGNGVHLWYSPRNRIERNTVRGHRDGIYFEFSPGSIATPTDAPRTVNAFWP